jgi:hypothetical protein
MQTEIHPIDDEVVQILVPHRDPILQFFAVEKAWFATDDHRLLGAVIYDRSCEHWAYIVLGPDEKGLYRWISGEMHLGSQENATAELLSEMERVAESGHQAFRRPIACMAQQARARRQLRRETRVARRVRRRAGRRLIGGLEEPVVVDQPVIVETPASIN